MEKVFTSWIQCGELTIRARVVCSLHVLTRKLVIYYHAGRDRIQLIAVKCKHRVVVTWTHEQA